LKLQFDVLKILIFDKNQTNFILTRFDQFVYVAFWHIMEQTMTFHNFSIQNKRHNNIYRCLEKYYYFFLFFFIQNEKILIKSLILSCNIYIFYYMARIIYYINILYCFTAIWNCLYVLWIVKTILYTCVIQIYYFSILWNITKAS
jgi:hypothetical protein